MDLRRFACTSAFTAKVLVAITILTASQLSAISATHAQPSAATSKFSLPISLITPGAIDPRVRQENIASTICVIGYTKSVRPPASYTTSLKRAQLAGSYSRYGDLQTRDFEEDHLISLELGGSPMDPKNLWPEPWGGDAGARMKDRLENKLHLLVCSGALPLATAQHAIAKNWVAAYLQYVKD